MSDTELTNGSVSNQLAGFGDHASSPPEPESEPEPESPKDIVIDGSPGPSEPSPTLTQQVPSQSSRPIVPPELAKPPAQPSAATSTSSKAGPSKTVIHILIAAGSIALLALVLAVLQYKFHLIPIGGAGLNLAR